MPGGLDVALSASYCAPVLGVVAVVSNTSFSAATRPIAEQRRGAVRLDVADLRGSYPAIRCAAWTAVHLTLYAGRGEADLGGAVVVDRGAPISART